MCSTLYSTRPAAQLGVLQCVHGALCFGQTISSSPDIVNLRNVKIHSRIFIEVVQYVVCQPNMTDHVNRAPFTSGIT